MKSSSNKRYLIDILKDGLIIALTLPTVALFAVLALGYSIYEPTIAVAVAELSLAVAVLGIGITMLYRDLKEGKR